MRDRIIEIRKEHHLSQEAFAKKLNLSRNFINQFENGNKNISDEFGLNEEWLKTGNGKKEKDIDVDYGTICTKISNEDPKAKEAIIKYFQLSKEDKELFWKFMERFVK